MPGTAQTLFDLCGGHPALDFVNSLDNRYRDDGPDERLTSYGDLLRFLAETHLLDPQRARSLGKMVTPEDGERVLRSVRELREAAAAVIYRSVAGKAPAGTDLRVLENHFLDACRHRELHWESADPAAEAAGTHANLVWRWGRHDRDPELPAWILSESVSDILTSDQLGHVRTCAADTCRWLFLDTSKNHSRRWCNMKVCGNRMKARRFQARRGN